MPQPQMNYKDYTYADYLLWPEEERWEIIDGVPYMMTAPSRIHQEIAGELLRQIGNYLQGKPCKVYIAPFEVRLPKGDEKTDQEIKTVVEPDLAIICDPSKLDERGCKGAPDFIIEIMSPSSVKNDILKKFYKYEKAGVKEYWIIEPNGKVVTVFTLGENVKYGRPEIYSDEDTVKVSIFQDLIIDMKFVFAY